MWFRVARYGLLNGKSSLRIAGIKAILQKD
jgi:hypothetical protein